MALSVVTRFRRPTRTQLFWAVGRVERLRLCAEIVNVAGRAVVFCRSDADAIRVASELSRIGVPAASVEHRDFSSSRVRARVVTDQTAEACGRESASCVIHYDLTGSARRYRRRLDLVAQEHATIVSFVVPEREPAVRELLRALDLPDVLTAPDVAAVADALAAAHEAAHAAPAPGSPAGDERPGRADALESRVRAAVDAARTVARQVPIQAARAGHLLGRALRARRSGAEAADGAEPDVAGLAGEPDAGEGTD